MTDIALDKIAAITKALLVFNSITRVVTSKNLKSVLIVAYTDNGFISSTSISMDDLEAGNGECPPSFYADEIIDCLVAQARADI